jgi:hypothetical protein
VQKAAITAIFMESEETAKFLEELQAKAQRENEDKKIDTVNRMLQKKKKEAGQ